MDQFDLGCRRTVPRWSGISAWHWEGKTDDANGLTQLVHDFFAAVTAGDLPDSLLTPDMKGWTTTQGTMEKADYQRVIRLLAKISARPLAFTINSITAEEDRAVAEVRSKGTLINGEETGKHLRFRVPHPRWPHRLGRRALQRADRAGKDGAAGADDHEQKRRLECGGALVRKKRRRR